MCLPEQKKTKMDRVVAALESIERKLSEKSIQTSDTPPYDRCDDPYYDHAESESAYSRRRELARCQIKALQRTLGHVETGYLSLDDGRALDKMKLVTLPFSWRTKPVDNRV